MANDPSFFCEVIRTVYKLNKEDKSQEKETTQYEKDMAANAYRFLREWKTVPGMNDEKEIIPEQLDIG